MNKNTYKIERVILKRQFIESIGGLQKCDAAVFIFFVKNKTQKYNCCDEIWERITSRITASGGSSFYIDLLCKT